MRSEFKSKNANVYLYTIMKKFIIGFITASTVLVSCSPAKIFLVNSEGILSYDKHTGKLELLWETKAKGGAATNDSIPLDSVLTIR